MRKSSLRPLSLIAKAQLKPLLAQNGFTQSALITQWDVIVGSEFARTTQPLKIVWPKQLKEGVPPAPATLHIQAETGIMLEVSYQQNLILERVNQFFGYRAIEKLKIVQGSIKRALPISPPKANEKQESEVKQIVGELNNSQLEAALLSLGGHIFAIKNE